MEHGGATADCGGGSGAGRFGCVRGAGARRQREPGVQMDPPVAGRLARSPPRIAASLRADAAPGFVPVRDPRYKRRGTVSLLPGIDLLTGRVHALVKDRHRSREFIKSLKRIRPTRRSKLILDNHSGHISKETKAWLAA